MLRQINPVLSPSHLYPMSDHHFWRKLRGTAWTFVLSRFRPPVSRVSADYLCFLPTETGAIIGAESGAVAGGNPTFRPARVFQSSLHARDVESHHCQSSCDLQKPINVSTGCHLTVCSFFVPAGLGSRLCCLQTNLRVVLQNRLCLRYTPPHPDDLK